MPAGPRGDRILVAVATPLEASAIAGPLGIDPATADPWVRIDGAAGFDLVVTGVGKANAAGAVARLLDTDRHVGVLNAGIAGLLPPAGGALETAGPLELGSAVLATTSIFGDEGIEEPGVFRSFAEMGFPLVGDADEIKASEDWVSLLRPLADAMGVVATISTCAGTDARARAVAERTGAIAEACEGAACGLSAVRAGVGFSEMRTISNTTGDRARQRWNIPLALERLERIFAETDLASRLIRCAREAHAG